MPLATRVDGLVMKRKRLWVDGMLLGSVRAGLDFEVATAEVNDPVYGSVSGMQMATYESGPQSIEVLEDPNSSLVKEMFAGIPDRAPTLPVLLRNSPVLVQHHGVVETLNTNLNGYGLGSTYLGHWSAALGTGRGDPSGAAVMTVNGPADAPLGISRGGQFIERRVALTSGASGWTGTWTGQIPLALAQRSNFYAVYLEMQAGDGYSRDFKEVTVDGTNVTPTAGGGTITVTHQDVIDAGFVSGGITHAWIIFAHNTVALQDHDFRWGLT